MNQIIIVILSMTILLFNDLGFAESERRVDKLNLTKSDLSMKGYDPVSYHQGNPIKGLKSLEFQYKGVRYFFATEENRTLFEKNPSLYEPAYGGWCAWAMLTGDFVSVNLKRYKIINGKTYLFYDGLFGDTLKKWNRLSEQKTEAAMIRQANTHWQRLMNAP